MSWHPGASREVCSLRSRLNNYLRGQLGRSGALEVETPILSRFGNTDPNIQSMRCAERYLQTSPEFPMKRLLASGSGDIFQMAKVFRAGEQGATHNPEFSLLEWYRVGWSYHQLMDEVADLINGALALVGRSASVVEITYGSLFKRRFGIDVSTADIDQIRALDEVRVLNPGVLNRDQLLDLLMGSCLIPEMPADQITLVYDFPDSQCALARVRSEGSSGEPAAAERFEAFCGGLELANGYQELTDPVILRSRLIGEQVMRRRNGLDVPTLDVSLCDAVTSGLPECAGVALGVDRLLMVLTEVDTISEVITFDYEHA